MGDADDYRIYMFLNLSLCLVSAVAYLGLLTINPAYVAAYNAFVHMVISAFLAWKFHPFRKTYPLAKHDPAIIFGLALYILTMSVIDSGDFFCKNFWGERII